MNYYEASLQGLKRILHVSGEEGYEHYIDECISEWQKGGKTQKLQAGFKKGGAFEKFSFENTRFTSHEQQFWYTKLFGGMVAMALQLARFQDEGRTVPIEFIRKNFGIPSDVISGTKCSKCGAKEITMGDIDKYITPKVVAAAIVDGLEQSCLIQNVDAVLELRSKELLQGREDAKLRAANTQVSVSSDRTPAAVCKHCGSSDLVRCRFLRHTKEPRFVALSR